MPGPLFAIGGAEAKLRRRDVLRAFVAESGGPDAVVAVVPTASSLGPEVIEVYSAVFAALGVAEVLPVRPESRDEAHDPELVARIERSTGVFMTGGNQLKLTAFVSGTPVGDAIVAAHRRGAVVGGTSAGASILAGHMIAFGAGGSTPKQRMSQLAAGLGLVPGAVIDQHFAQRNRYGRLMSLVAQSPSLLGIGVDEDTAAVFRLEPDAASGVLEVIGRGAVSVLDGSRSISNAHVAKRTAPLLLSGAVLHVLPAGSRFDLATRTLIEVATDVEADELEEVRAAENDLRKLAQDIRDITSDGIGPANFARKVRRGGPTRS